MTDLPTEDNKSPLKDTHEDKVPDSKNCYIDTKVSRSYTVYIRNPNREHRPVGEGKHYGERVPTSSEAGKCVTDPSSENLGNRINSQADPPGGEFPTNREIRKETACHVRSTEKEYNKNPRPISIINGAPSDDDATEPVNCETYNAASSSDGRKETYDKSCKSVNGKGSHDTTALKPKEPAKKCGSKGHHTRGIPIYNNIDPINDTSYTVDTGPIESLTEFAARVFVDFHVPIEGDPFAPHR